MLEVQPIALDAVGCFGRPAALDELAEMNDWGVRVAPDELIVFRASATSGALEGDLLARDAGGVVIDLSGAYAIWAIRGHDRYEAFCRLSAIALPEPPAFVQGLVGQVPAKVVVHEDELVVIASSVHSHHFRARLFGACVDLAPLELGQTEDEVPV